MLARIPFGIVLIVAAFAQATVLPAWWPLEVQPNLVLILLLVWAAIAGVGEGVLWAGAVGVLLDLLAVVPVGTNGLALLVVVLLAGFARQRVFQSSILVPFILAIVAGFLQPLVLTMLGSLTGRDVLPLGALVRTVAPQALLCALFVPPVYLLAGWFARRFAEV